MKAELTTDGIRELQEKFREITDLLQEIAEAMDRAGAEAVLIHTRDAENKHLPALWRWARKAKAEVEMQLAVFETAKRDRALHDALAAEKRKR